MKKRIYSFDAQTGGEGDASQAWLLGGKGANLAEMCNMGIPVPPGFTITTDVCKTFEQMAVQEPGAIGAWKADLLEEVFGRYADLTVKMGYPPLVSVRSGAPVSMPGMMDTILNVGLTKHAMPDWIKRLGARAAWDSRRRLIQMLGCTAFGIEHGAFEQHLTQMKFKRKVKTDSELSASDMEELSQTFLGVFQAKTDGWFPETVAGQLSASVLAVFQSWQNPRAIEYRKINKIDPAMGTAVTVQAMVFGNMGGGSGTGVLFSRDAATGENTVLGEFLQDAQGEDVVAGIRTPLPLSDMEKLHGNWQAMHKQLLQLTAKLENHYRDMMDIEFTVQEGVLWMLQCRIGKRSALAAVKIARQFMESKHITGSDAVKRVTREQYKALSRPMVDPKFTGEPNFVGKGASPGVAVGIVVLTAESAVNCKSPCVLVTDETNPDDIAGMHKAQGILTRTGGATSHAAVVARSMNKPCVVGCVDLPADLADIDGHEIVICGATGRVWLAAHVPVVDATEEPDLQWFKELCLEKSGFAMLISEAGTNGHLPIKVMVADFWGQDDKLQQLLSQIAENGNVGQVLLDVTPPGEFVIEHDMEYLGMLDQIPGNHLWFNTLGYQFMEVSDMTGLEHLVICGSVAEEARTSLRKWGYTVAGPATRMADLFSGYCEVTNDFIDKVIGSTDAWERILAALNDSGVEMKSVPRAVPLEYAVLIVLDS